MKRITSLFFLAFLSLPQLFAQAPTSSLLWKISGNGLQAPSYLFGTSHIMCKDDFTITPILRSSLLSTKQFYGELKMDDPTMQMQMMKEMIMKDKTLESFMTAEEYEKVNIAFQKITGMPITMFKQFKPFMSLSVLYLAMATCTEKVQPETEFMQIAKDGKLPILGLETVAEQMKAIDKFPIDSQVVELKKMVLNFDSVKAEMQKMNDFYKTRDIDSIYHFIVTGGSAAGTGLGPNMEKDLIITRNNNWLPLIKKAITAKSTFFAVGAGHLGGKTGVVNLLRTEGYKVTPVKF
ncbi:MAG: TraB/GumN family protein [Sediminibacterium sp.]